MHFGATLRMLRTDAGFSLRDLADAVGVSNAYLSRVENGHDPPPTPDRLTAIARALALPPTVLFEIADRVGPTGASYLERVPVARDLLIEIVRRNLDAVQIARVKAFIERECAPAAESPSRKSPLSLLSTGRIVIDLACSDLEDVIDVAAIRIAPAAGVDRVHAVSEAIQARERESSTALGGGFGAPHAIVPGAEPAAALVILRRAIRHETPDGVAPRAFFVHVHPKGGREHLDHLVQLARFADADLVKELCLATSPRHVMRILEGAER